MQQCIISGINIAWLDDNAKIISLHFEHVLFLFFFFWNEWRKLRFSTRAYIQPTLLKFEVCVSTTLFEDECIQTGSFSARETKDSRVEENTFDSSHVHKRNWINAFQIFDFSHSRNEGSKYPYICKYLNSIWMIILLSEREELGYKE